MPSSHQKNKRKVFITWNTDGTGSLLVAHHQDLELLDIVDQELLEASGQHVLGLLVATITNVGHQHLTLEPPADPVVNTSGLTPVFLQQWNKCTSINHKSNTETSSRLLTSQVQTGSCCHEAYRNLHISVRLVANELLGSLFDNLGLREGPEGCHGDCEQQK